MKAAHRRYRYDGRRANRRVRPFWTVMPQGRRGDGYEYALARARRQQSTPGLVAELADAALESGREEEAVPYVIDAIRRFGPTASLWQWLGMLYRGLDEHKTAMAAFEQAAALNPTDVRAAHALARTCFEAGLPASSLFARALDIAPGTSDILLGRAGALVSEGEAALAIGELDALLSTNPRWIAGHEHAAHIRWMSGDRDGFLNTVETALAQMPSNPTLWGIAQKLLFVAKNYERAIVMVDGARRAIGQERLFDEYEAQCASELSLARADALFDALMPLRTIASAVHFMRHQLRRGRPERALDEAMRWMKDPNSTMLWPYVGLAWRLLDDPRAAWLEGDERLVGIYDIAGQLPHLATVADLLCGLHAVGGQQLSQSVDGGTQTSGPLLSRIDPDIRVVRQAIVAAITMHVSQLPERDDSHPTLRYDPRRRTRFSGSWSVRLKAGGYHTNHCHDSGWLSSALYISVPNADPGDEGHEGWLSLGEPQRELGLSLAPSRLIEPKPGRLVLFPSTMWHGTRAFAEGERLTIAFDVARQPCSRAGQRA